MDIKEAALSDAAAPTDADSTSSGATARRRVLSVGIAGATASLLPFLTRRASAGGALPATASTTGGTTETGASVPPGNGYNATGDSTNASSDVTTAATDAATTTTAPPKRPTEDDIVLLSFAQQVELTIRNLYDVALGANTFEGATLEAVKAIREAHEAYAQSLSGLLGRVSPNTPIDELFSSMQADFSGSAADVAAAAQALENTAVATHSELVGQLIGIDGSGLVASMLIVEARHATYLATLAGAKTLEDELTGDATALSPSDYTAK